MTSIPVKTENTREENTKKKAKEGLSWKTKFYIAAGLTGLVLVIGIFTTYKISKWFEGNRLVWQSIVQIHFRPPVYAAKREKPQPIIEEVLANQNSPLTPEQQYICDTFGENCKMALAVAKAENGTWQCDRFNINTNGTIDVGLFQVNSVHLKKGVFSLADLVDCKKNVDIAYQIFKTSGWNPWVTFNNKSYLKFMY